MILRLISTLILLNPAIRGHEEGSAQTEPLMLHLPLSKAETDEYA